MQVYHKSIPVAKVVNSGTSIDDKTQFLTNRKTGKPFRANKSQRLKNAEVPFPFRDSNRDETRPARRALEEDGAGTRLLQAIRKRKTTPALYSLTAKDLGIDVKSAHGHLIFNPAVVETWKRHIRQTFGDLYIFYSIEVGENGKINAHVVAGLWEALPHLTRGKMFDGVPVEVITPGTEKRLFSYLYKSLPQLPKLIAAHDEAIAKGQKIPKRHGYFNAPRPVNPFILTRRMRKFIRENPSVRDNRLVSLPLGQYPPWMPSCPLSLKVPKTINRMLNACSTSTSVVAYMVFC